VVEEKYQELLSNDDPRRPRVLLRMARTRRRSGRCARARRRSSTSLEECSAKAVVNEWVQSETAALAVLHARVWPARLGGSDPGRASRRRRSHPSIGLLGAVLATLRNAGAAAPAAALRLVQRLTLRTTITHGVTDRLRGRLWKPDPPQRSPRGPYGRVFQAPRRTAPPASATTPAGERTEGLRTRESGQTRDAPRAVAGGRQGPGRSARSLGLLHGSS